MSALNTDTAAIKILVVDDSEEIRAILTTICKKIDGVEVSEAENGAEALEKFKKTAYDITLMDLMMPVMDGVEATEKIKALYPKTLVLVITAVVDQAVENKILRIGATTYIRKPIKNPKLTRVKIENFVNYVMSQKQTIGGRLSDSSMAMNPFAESIRAVRTMANIIKEDDLMDIALWITDRYMKRHASQGIVIMEIFNIIYEVAAKALKSHISTAVYIEENFDWIYITMQITEPIDAEKLNKNQQAMLGKYICFDHDYLYLKVAINEEYDARLETKAIQYEREARTEPRIEPQKETKPIEIKSDPNAEKNIKNALENQNGNQQEEPLENFRKSPREKEKQEIEKPFAQTPVTDANKQSRSASVEEQDMLRKSYTEKLSAAEYARTLSSMDIETVQDMEDLERDLDELLSVIEKEFTAADAQKIGEIFQRYAGIISQLYEFAPLSYALSSLGALFDGIDETSMARLNEALIRALLRGVYEDMRKWRDTIFISQSTADVHYLDASLLSSCMQVESLLLNQEVTAGDDSGDLELF